MNIGALVVLESAHNGMLPGSVAEVVDPTTSDHYKAFCDWIVESQAMDAWQHFVCVKFLGDGNHGFYHKSRFRFLDIHHNSQTAN